MKKLIAIILSLAMLLSLAACAPNEGATEPATDAPTEQPTEKPTEKPTEAPTDAPTDPEPTDPEPTDPPTLQDAGYCAVGIVDAEAGTAKILADNGVIEEIPYTSEEEIVPGNIYAFAKNGDVYQLTPVVFYNQGAWGFQTMDRSGPDGIDQLYGHNGVSQFSFDLTEDFVAFVRFSETEWRIFRGSDAIQMTAWPCYMQVAVTAVEEVGPPNAQGVLDYGTCHLILVVGDVTIGQAHCDETGSYVFDPEGYGWNDGDLIIE